MGRHAFETKNEGRKTKIDMKQYVQKFNGMPPLASALAAAAAAWLALKTHTNNKRLQLELEEYQEDMDDALDETNEAKVGLSLHSRGCQRTTRWCHQLVFFGTVRATRLVTPGGCQTCYSGHPGGCFQLNRVLTCKNTSDKLT
jgi:hypothetical protein